MNLKLNNYNKKKSITLIDKNKKKYFRIDIYFHLIKNKLNILNV